MPSTQDRTSTTYRPVDRILEGFEEARLDLGLSRRELGELAGVTGETVRKVERGRTANPHTVTQLQLALVAVELCTPPRPTLDAELAASIPLRAPEKPPLPFEIDTAGARQWVAPVVGARS